MVTDKRWKKTEREVARILGGERIPVSGRQRGYSADVQHDFFSIEVKDRLSLPEWILEAMEQAQASKRGDKIPLVVLHQKGMKYPDSFAILKLSDLCGMMSKISELEAKVEILQDDIASIYRNGG